MPGGGVYYKGRSHLLYVDINHIAALRDGRGGPDPDPVEAALICEQSGCDGITVRLRKNRQPITKKDVSSIKERIRGKLNLEAVFSDDVMDLAEQVKPDKIILVPENRDGAAAPGGFDVGNRLPGMKEVVESLHDRNILVSLLIAPVPEAIELSKACRADFVQIHTGAYGKAAGETEIDKELARIYRAAELALQVGLKVSAGHGLNYGNILPVLKARAMEEVSIGHAIISRALFVGLSRAVEEMLEILE